jgi:sporulation protein YlmC with PRC-barrel domain
MRLSDLRDKRVVTLDGERLGRVHEVHCEKGRVVALMCGTASLVERLTGGRQHGRRIPWECVRKVEAKQIVVTPAPPQRQSSSASRSRQGTRRPSAPR